MIEVCLELIEQTGMISLRKEQIRQIIQSDEWGE